MKRTWLVLVLVVIALSMWWVASAAHAALTGLYAPRLQGTSRAVGAVAAFLLVGFLALVILGGVIYCAVLTVVRRKIRAAQDWPAAKGVVMTSEVRDAGGESGLYVSVVYRYEVGGRVYENSRIAVAVEYGSHSPAALERLAARFPVGAQVRVYYDPQNPADSALVKGDPNSWAPSRF